MPYCTIPERLQYYASKLPDTEALVIVGNDKRDAVTYKEVMEKGAEMAKKFLTLGIQQRDIVAIHDEKTPMWLYCTLGLQMCGAWPLHFFFQRKDGTDVIDMMQSTRCKYLITQPGEDDYFADIVQTFACNDGNGKFSSDALPNLQCVLFTEKPIRVPNALTMKSLPSATFIPSTIEPENIAGIFCSSGTTGKPKLIPRTHVDLVRASLISVNCLDMAEGERFFCERTFSWAAGYPLNMIHGITQVTSTKFFQLKTIKGHMESTVDIFEKERCNHAILFSSIIAEILASKPNMKPLKTVLCGGGPIPAKDTDLIPNYCEKFVNIYGSTEFYGTTYNIVRKSGAMKNFDTGIPYPGMEVKIIRADGSLADIGESGEICERGIYGTKGYIHEKLDWHTKNTIAEGWYKPGDAGYITEEGHLFVTGRIADVIIVEGRLVSPAYLEDIFMRHPYVENVVAFAIPDRKMHELPGVAITIKHGSVVTEGELLNFFVKERNVILQESIFESKVQPEKVIFFDDFPKTSSGKIARTTVKKMALERV